MTNSLESVSAAMSYRQSPQPWVPIHRLSPSTARQLTKSESPPPESCEQRANRPSSNP